MQWLLERTVHVAKLEPSLWIQLIELLPVVTMVALQAARVVLVVSVLGVSAMLTPVLVMTRDPEAALRIMPKPTPSSGLPPND